MIYRLKYLFESFEGFIKNIYDSLISIIKILVLSRFNVKLPKATNKECIILGNGPSLKNVLDFKRDFFLGKDLFCVNMFPSSKEFSELKPTNLVWLDTGFYMFKDLDSMKLKRPDVYKVINDLIEKTSWDLILYIPTLAKNANYLRDIQVKNTLIKIQFYNYTIVKGFFWFRHLFFKANLGMPLCQNVLGASLFLALNKGYKQLYVLGADHTWAQSLVVEDNNELGMKQFHFNSDNEKPKITTIYKSPESKQKIKISEFFMACVKTFEVYYVLEEYSKALHAKIINATEGSYIDAFEKKKI
jgi:hypothetical protein